MTDESMKRKSRLEFENKRENPERYSMRIYIEAMDGHEESDFIVGELERTGDDKWRAVLNTPPGSEILGSPILHFQAETFAEVAALLRGAFVTHSVKADRLQHDTMRGFAQAEMHGLFTLAEHTDSIGGYARALAWGVAGVMKHLSVSGDTGRDLYRLAFWADVELQLSKFEAEEEIKAGADKSAAEVLSRLRAMFNKPDKPETTE